MMGASILLKALALVLVPYQSVLAMLAWGLGALVDVWVFRRRAGGTQSRWQPLANVLLMNAACIALGWAVGDGMTYAAMRWKAGLPLPAAMAGWVLNALQLPVAHHAGQLHLTTMTGPLTMPASLDTLGLHLPAWVLTFAAVALLIRTRKPAWVVSGIIRVALVLALASLLRFITSIGLFVALCDFISYESDELPISPFLRHPFIAWSYLPFMLAAWPLVNRAFRLPPPAQATSAPTYAWAWVVGPALLALLLWIGLRPPDGDRKHGAVVISTFHTQWSPAGRPYDREWYGADSGYNYAGLKRWLGVFYDVQENRQAITAETLADASVLMIYLPDKPLSPDERMHIEAFVRRGGGLFVVGDHTNVFGSTSHLNALCEPFGFQFRDDVLFDLDADFFQLVDLPPPRQRLLHGMPFFKFRGPASIKPTAWGTRPVLTVGHAKAIRAIYSVNNFYPPPHDHPRMQTGLFCVAASSHFGRGRVVAFADSTVFSNFEIFYPGKYEFLVNTMEWLNHADHSFGTLLRRSCLAGALLVLVGLCVILRGPRRLLMLLTVTVVTVYAVRTVHGLAEHSAGAFPQPNSPARALFFIAEPEDASYVLRDFVSEEPYEQRYDVFIQWALRADVFPGFFMTGLAEPPALHAHLAAADPVDTALALIVRGAKQVAQLKEVGPLLRAAPRSLVLMTRDLSWDDASAALVSAGLIGGDGELVQLQTGWPDGHVTIERAEGRLMVVFDAERFSDRAMGFSEKVSPDATQRARYDQAFSIIDALFDGSSGE